MERLQALASLDFDTQLMYKNMVLSQQNQRAKQILKASTLFYDVTQVDLFYDHERTRTVLKAITKTCMPSKFDDIVFVGLNTDKLDSKSDCDFQDPLERLIVQNKSTII
jgi:hypothetical protein